LGVGARYTLSFILPPTGRGCKLADRASKMWRVAFLLGRQHSAAELYG